MSSRVFSVSVLLPFLLFVGRIYTNHTYVSSFLKFGHITGRIFTTSESLFMSTDGVFGSRSAVTSYLDFVFDRPFNSNAEFLSNDPLSALLGWSLHKMEGAMTVGLTVILSWKLESGTVAIHTAVSPSCIDTEWEASQEFVPPLTQLITKCKRGTKITRKIKRSKESHCYYLNSVVTDRLVLAGW